jgi:hypothetical protein
MIGTGFFNGQAGGTFALKVVGTQNALSCTAVVLEAQGASAHELERLDFDELRAGKAFGPLQAGHAYRILMRGESKAAGQQVSVNVEVPSGSPAVTCSRMSSGVIGDWTVNVF